MPIFGPGRSRSYAVLTHSGVAFPEPPDTLGEAPPELADVDRLARRIVSRAVQTARAEEAPVPRLLRAHLGSRSTELPVARRSWPRYEQVNVQHGLEAWLAEGGREHQLNGLTRYRHRDFGLADLLHSRHLAIDAVQNEPQSGGTTLRNTEWDLSLPAPAWPLEFCRTPAHTF